MNYFLMLLIFELNAWQKRGGEKIEGGCSPVRNYANIYCIYIYALSLFTEHSGEHWWKQNIFCWFTTP